MIRTSMNILKCGWYSAHVYNTRTRIGVHNVFPTKERAKGWMQAIKNNPACLGGI